MPVADIKSQIIGYATRFADKFGTLCLIPADV